MNGLAMSTRKLPHLTWLRAFEASARHLSFTNAAMELNLTQAAISKQVKLLEQYLREPLFERKPRSLVLTKVGAAYLPKVRDGFDRLAAGTQEVFGHRRSEVLTVRAPVGYSVNWIAPRLKNFFDKHPDISLRLVSSVWGEQFDSERFDLDIQYGTGRWPGFQSDRLTWEVILPVCSPALLEGAKPLREPSDLADHCLLHVLGYEAGWSDWLKQANALGVDSLDRESSSIHHFWLSSLQHGGAVSPWRVHPCWDWNWNEDVWSGHLISKCHYRRRSTLSRRKMVENIPTVRHFAIGFSKNLPMMLRTSVIARRRLCAFGPGSFHLWVETINSTKLLNS